MAKLKICGITNLPDAQVAADLGVHWLGFNFYIKSPRYIAPQDASEIMEKITDRVETVAILVHPTLEEIKDIVNDCPVDWLQIYQATDIDHFGMLDKPVIDCYRIKPGQNIELKKNDAAMILLDSYSKDVLGGSGERFEWKDIPAEIPKEKLVLAGGINPNNITSALRTVNPAVIDVASGAEKEPGVKDPVKIKQLMNEINKYNEENR